jgi:hypothetical protein
VIGYGLIRIQEGKTAYEKEKRFDVLRNKINGFRLPLKLGSPSWEK